MFECGFVSVAILPSVFARSMLLIRHETPTKFISILEQDPDDSLAQIYLERCAYFIKTPPSDEWDGVWVMKTK